MGTYVELQGAKDFALSLYPEYNTDLITENVLGATYDQINKRTGCVYSQVDTSVDGVLLFNGDDTDTIFITPNPIVNITSLKSENITGEETSYYLTGSNKNVWVDKKTGLLKLTNARFPKGYENIKVEGLFGEETPDLVIFLQNLLILKHLSVPGGAGNIIKADIIEEKLGRYEYKLSSGQTGKNQRVGLDGYIESIFVILEKEDFALEAI